MTDVQIRGLRKAFGTTTVLAGLDLEVPARSVTAVLGPSGCGKTTLLRVVAGFETADAGTVRIGDVEVTGPETHVPPERRHIGVVPQDQSLFPHLSVARNIGYGVARADRRARVAELLEMSGLAGLGDRMPHELSGGQQQRVAVARALAPRPGVVLLDEPFGGLDAALRESIRSEVCALLREAGTTAVLVTHDQEEALSVADRIAIMRDGRIVQAGAPRDVYTAPVDLDVAHFVGVANVLVGEARAGRVQSVLGTLRVSGSVPDGPVEVLLRPEQLLIGRQGVTGRVVDRQYYGHDAMLTIVLGDDGTRLRVRVSSRDAAAAGEEAVVRAVGPVVCYPVTRSA